MKPKLLASLVLPFLLLTISCGSASRDAAPTMPATTAEQSPAAASPASYAAKSGSVDADATTTTKPVSLEKAGESDQAAQAVERKIIRNADMVLEVDDPSEAQRKVAAIAEANGGFVVTSEMQQSAGGSQTVTVTVRVPSAQFGAAMDALRSSARRIVSEKVSGQDVTEEFIDLEARIRTKKALEAQFLEIMKQAHTVSDALEVQSQIANVRTEVEQLEGRRRFLENRAALSTITARLQGPQPVVTASRSGIPDAIQRAFGDAVDTASAIVTGFIRIVGVLVPVILLIGVPFWLVIRFLWRRYVRKPATTE